MKKTSRRRVLAGVAAIGVLPLIAVRQAPERPDRDLASRLTRLIPYPVGSARVVGDAYLEVVPQDRAVPTLELYAAGAVSAAGTGSPELSDSELLRRYYRRVRDDFASANVVSIGGWLLSRSEARLCALITLTARP